MTLQDDLLEASAALEHGDAARAERIARRALGFNSGSADAWHLLGLAQRRLGHAQLAGDSLRRSIEAAPRRAEFRLNYGNLLRAGGRLQDAELQYRTALELDKGNREARLALARLLSEGGAHQQAAAEARELLRRDGTDADAWAALGVAERGLKRPAEAEAAYRRALALRPSYAIAHHNLGALLGEMHRAEDSLAELELAAANGLSGPSLQFNRGRALMELGRYDEAEAALTQSVTAAPVNVAAQTLLAKLRYMRGDPRYARDLEAALQRTGNASLQFALGDLYRRAGDLQGAAALLRSLQERSGWTPAIGAAVATVLQESGQLAEALDTARAAAQACGDDPVINETLVMLLLQTGDAGAALDLAVRMREAHPGHHRWLAHQATAARLLGDPAYEELYDYERFVLPFDLEPPPGYASVEAFHEALVPVLQERHRFARHPLDQSLREGTQTSRSLLADPEPVIQQLLAAFARPIARYREAIGRSDSHPYLARNQGPARLAGCWSVRLRRGGYHVNHIHPEGWISSAYYVAVPPEVEDPEARSGWIKFGEPRQPVSGATPAYFVKPKAGRLVLFPSYMWHGTTPIVGDEPRITVAFDVVTG